MTRSTKRSARTRRNMDQAGEMSSITMTVPVRTPRNHRCFRKNSDV
jgi:hypothetical protein